jgi:2-iminobutanoate/2-iminopropanoate deaminase
MPTSGRGAEVRRWAALIPTLIIVAMTFPTAAFAQEREVIRLPGSLEGLPFSSAVKVGNMLYLSGQIGILPGTRQLADGSVAGETRQTMENIKQVLEFAGSSLEHVVKCTVFLADISYYAEMNEVYASYFGENPPARSAMAGSGLALGASVEIECIAVIER